MFFVKFMYLCLKSILYFDSDEVENIVIACLHR